MNLALENAVPSRTGERVSALVVTAVPLLFLLVGLVIRYAAFLSISDETGWSPFVDALCKWDCFWYIGIAEGGYEPYPTPDGRNVGAWGFFPLYPTLVGLLAPLSPLRTIDFATLMSLAVSYCACLCAWPLLGRELRTYTLYCAFLLAGPFSVYHSTFLTEPLFVLLTILVLLALKRSNYIAAAGFAALLSATRIVGVFMVFPIVIQMFMDHRRAGGTLLSFPRHLLGRPDLLLAIFLAPVGLFAYMLFLHLLLGDGFAFAHVQRAFGRTMNWPFLFLWDGLVSFPREGWWPTAPQISAVTVLLGLGLSLWLFFGRRQYGVATFCLIAIILPIFSGLASTVRYITALSPLTLELSVLLSRWRVLAGITAAAFMIACYFTTRAWLEAHLALV